jgi:hypothetical protein
MPLLTELENPFVRGSTKISRRWRWFAAKPVRLADFSRNHAVGNDFGCDFMG